MYSLLESKQGRRKQASSDARVARQLGGSGGKFWIFKPSEIVSGAFLR